MVLQYHNGHGVKISDDILNRMNRFFRKFEFRPIIVIGETYFFITKLWEKIDFRFSISVTFDSRGKVSLWHFKTTNPILIDFYVCNSRYLLKSKGYNNINLLVHSRNILGLAWTHLDLWKTPINRLYFSCNLVATGNTLLNNISNFLGFQKLAVVIVAPVRKTE